MSLPKDLNDFKENHCTTLIAEPNSNSFFVKVPVADYNGSNAKVVGSIFPKKLSFDGNQCRTPVLQEVIFWVLSHSKGYRAKKNEQLLKKLQLFAVVEPEGIEPSS